MQSGLAVSDVADSFALKRVDDALAEAGRGDIDQVIVLASGDVEWPAEHGAGLVEPDVLLQDRGCKVEMGEPFFQVRGRDLVVKEHEDVGGVPLVGLDARRGTVLFDVADVLEIGR